MIARMLFATGYEEVEALTVVDLLRRAGIDCRMVSVYDEDYAVGSHNITIKMDEKISEIGNDADAVILPGGMPGVTNLIASEKVKKIVTDQYNSGKLVAAVCAAPTALGSFGILKDKKATCYPGMEGQLNSREFLTDTVVTDGNVVTSRGMGTSIEFGLKIVELLKDKNTADDLAVKIVYR